MHVDRLFDVGLYLIEELARCPPSQSPGCVCVCLCVSVTGREDEWGHRWPLAYVWVPL